LALRLAQAATTCALADSTRVGQLAFSMVLRKQVLQKPPSLNWQTPRQGEETGVGVRGLASRVWGGFWKDDSPVAGDGDAEGRFLTSDCSPRPAPPFIGMADGRADGGWCTGGRPGVVAMWGQAGPTPEAGG